jgi:hypothetical protein
MMKLILSLLLTAASVPLQAGIRVDLESRGGAVGTDTGRIEGILLIEGKRFRMDLGTQRSLIFLAAGPSVLLINHEERWYTELDKTSAKSIAANIDPMARELREQLSSLPDDQREWVSQMLGGTLNLSKTDGPDTLRVEETGRTGKSPEGRQCRWLKVYGRLGLAQENCIGPSNSLTGGDELELALAAAARFYQDVTAELNGSGLLPLPEYPLPELVPPGTVAFISRRFQAGEVQTDTRIMGSKRLDIEEQAFQAPAGYARREPGLRMAMPK